MMKKVTKAVIPAAGLGTRVLPATKAMPKGMLPIVDKPAIQYLVEEAVRSGITDILIILGRNQSIPAKASRFGPISTVAQAPSTISSTKAPITPAMLTPPCADRTARR